MRKAISVLWRYIAALMIAVMVYGLSAILLKWTGVTMNGPTLGSRILETVVFYAAFCAAVFVLFLKFGPNRPLEGRALLPLCAASLFVIHILAAAFSSWSALWFITTGASALAEIVFAGGRGLSSLTEIPRAYYLLALGLEDVCFLTFSWAGFCLAPAKWKRK